MQVQQRAKETKYQDSSIVQRRDDRDERTKPIYLQRRSSSSCSLGPIACRWGREEATLQQKVGGSSKQ
jgi:hypothetical protein